MNKYKLLGALAATLVLAAACGTDTPGTELTDTVAGSGGRSSVTGGKAGRGGTPGGGGSQPKPSEPTAGAAPGGAPPAIGCNSNADCEKQLGKTTPADCAVAKCSVTTGECVFAAVDSDGDGYRTADCSADTVELEAGDDCDDANPQTFPGAWDGPKLKDKREDRCDQQDNDCNGKPDDATEAGATCVCDPVTDIDVPCDELADGTAIKWPSGTAKGSCKQGKKTCFDGAWGKCEGAMLPKEKDGCVPGNDDTCDGMANVGCACKGGQTRNCGTDTGSCQHGTQTCGDDGNWGAACVGEIAPKTGDTCDDKNDDNCNDKPNEGCSCINGMVRTCAEVYGSQGACASGKVTCVGGKWPSSCPVQAAKELCDSNGVDEDCNGNPFNGCECTNGQTQANSCGACGDGYKICSGGTYANSGCYGGTSKATFYRDSDGDGYCNRGDAKSECSKPNGYLSSSCSSDCRDGNGYIPGQNSHCDNFYLGSSNNHSCATFGAGCGKNNEWQISWDSESPGACPAGFHPKCSARWVSGNAGTQCWLASEDYYANTWSCRLHPSSAGFDGVTCALDVQCWPD